MGIINDAAIEHVPIKNLIEHPKNPRHGSVEAIAESISANGFYGALIVQKSTNRVLAGNHRVKALKHLGITEAPVIYVDVDDDRALRILLADNRANDLAAYNQDVLANLLTDLASTDLGLEGTLFDTKALDDVLAELTPDTKEGKTDPDDVPDAPEDPVTKPGDLWILGNHRLLCGDSTNPQHVERLMDGKKADMVFTDPPYNVAFNGRSGKFDVIKNDDLSETDFDQLIADTVATIKRLNSDAYYVWCNWKFYATLQTKLDFKGCIVWAKNVFGMGNGYRHQHEFCLYNGTIDPSIKNESDLWHVSKDSSYMHPTQKPVELSRRALRNHAKAKIIVDLFGGSGSTLIGCEQEGRHCRMMELDPSYCDVIIKRWEEFTGEKAVLHE